MNITIKTIPHAEQRYETVGDWWFDEAGNLEIRVSNMGNWKHEALVAFHELAEVLLCRDRGISAEAVDMFDERYKGDGEPGDQPDAPYRKEHFFATTVERMLCAEFREDWAEYDDAVNAL